ncbi:DNA-binding response regulator [Bordetella genomosp. 1]|uniref:DNA-binding response regulator n=1 Tax=Bordetella genomosp. 1 TaxID=1395607 RepID=A0A261RU50_9BORD|nr:response regulator transcription factor [Bordetella genomosp. 1]MDQ8033342.1 response regulator transcription factor [Bordetella sp.]OZI28297.1 DNA-binding response regulator [Bordetella genomosp. 1]OZI69335.1 DNA-binding response regulator [Bordetella genomosp. 1]
MKIASLEDDLDQARQIQQVLVDAGYECRSFQKSQDLLAALRTDAFDLILVDWQLPDIDGDEVVRRLRARYGNSAAIIFLTSRNQEEDLVEGLRAGADDYIVKPLRPAELLARAGALLRRTQPSRPDLTAFSVAQYRIDPAERTITLHGEAISLPPKEYELALIFFRNVGRLMSRDLLAESVWNREIPATSRTLDTHLSNVRQKLQLRPENGVRLTSSYALGYRLDLVADSPAA